MDLRRLLELRKVERAVQEAHLMVLERLVVFHWRAVVVERGPCVYTDSAEVVEKLVPVVCAVAAEKNDVQVMTFVGEHSTVCCAV